MKQFLAAVFILALAAGDLRAQHHSSPERAERPKGEMIELLMPAPPAARPQTEEQKAASSRSGRPRPPREVLQPAVDPALPAYRPRKDIKLSGTFKGASSDTLPGLVKLWVEGFQKHYPDVNIGVPPPYSGTTGSQEFVKGNLDFVFVSRELRPDNLAEFKAKFGYEPLSVPISRGSYRHFGFLDTMVVIVHKDNPLEKISYEQFDAIYSSTRHRGGAPISTWGQLGLTGEWKDKPIQPYGIKPWNDFEEYLRQRILNFGGKRGEWRDNVKFDPVIFPLAGRVAEDRSGIGYSGLAYLDAGVRILPVGESAGGPFYAPAYENVADASYPLTRLIYLNVNKAPGKPLDPVIEEFLRYILSREGQEAVVRDGTFLPLTADVASGQLSSLE